MQHWKSENSSEQYLMWCIKQY